MIEVNTKNILFIAGGAFVGLKDLIKNLLNIDIAVCIFLLSSRSLVEVMVLVVDWGLAKSLADAGCNAYIAKPFSPRTLLKLIREHLPAGE